MRIISTIKSVLVCCTALVFSLGGEEIDPHYQFHPGMERAHSVQCDANWDSSGMMETDLFYVTKGGPQKVCRGDEVTVNICVRAKLYVKDVIITDSFAPGVTYVSSEPEASVHDNHFQWRISEMQAGETQNLKVTVRANQVGRLCDCLTIIPICRLCRSTCVGDCELHIEKIGPDCLCLNQIGNYTVTVSNTGDACARDVVVTDIIPDGMSHSCGENVLKYEIGDLMPGCTKRLSMDFQADEAGRHCNIARVSASNSPDKSAQVCTEVLFADIQVDKIGASEQFICKNVTYNIIVKNTGTSDLHDVVVRDKIDCNTEIVDAEGADICGDFAIWKIATLRAGETHTLSITLRADCIGAYTNKVDVSGTSDCCCGPACDCAEATTTWKGHPGLLMEMVDSCDPLCVGEFTEYTLLVKNQGTASDTNIKLVVSFSSGLAAESTQSEGSISEQTITFGPIDELAPGEVRQYCFTLKGVSTGDSRVRVEMSSDSLDRPVIEEESTYIY